MDSEYHKAMNPEDAAIIKEEFPQFLEYIAQQNLAVSIRRYQKVGAYIAITIDVDNKQAGILEKTVMACMGNSVKKRAGLLPPLIPAAIKEEKIDLITINGIRYDPYKTLPFP